MRVLANGRRKFNARYGDKYGGIRDETEMNFTQRKRRCARVRKLICERFWHRSFLVSSNFNEIVEISCN